MIKKYYFNLETDATNINIGAIKQNETNSIEFHINMTDRGNLVDLSDVAYATITTKKPDGTYNNGYCEIVDLKKLKYEVPINVLNQVGVCVSEVHLFSQDSVVKISAYFHFDVKESLLIDEGVTTQPEYPILVQLITDVTDLETDIETAEALRVDAENGRVTAESGRVSSENTRVLFENSREAQEDTRQLNELTRVSNENARIQNENERIENEIVRENFSYRGVYNASSAYLKNNIVLFNNESYIALQNSAGVEPTNTSYWGKLIIASSGTGDMQKSVYDTDNDGVVDNSEKLGGQPPDYFSKQSDYTSHLNSDMPHKLYNAKDGKYYRFGEQLSADGKPQLIFEEV